MDLAETKDGHTNRHPWELSRADSILKLLSQYPSNFQYADIGAGDNYFAALLSEHLVLPVYTVDTGYSEIGRKGKLIQLASIKDLPEASLDMALLMDVIEHIEDVDSFLSELLTKVKPGGRLIITVPAFQFLYSQHDVFLKHYRRYNLASLVNTVKNNGLTVENGFYFYASLFFVRCTTVVIEKIVKPRNMEGISNWPYPADHLITRFVRGFLNLDFNISYFLSKFHLTLPGLSLCVICRKKY